jgi:hypothetical protein
MCVDSFKSNASLVKLGIENEAFSVFFGNWSAVILILKM